MSLCSVAFTVLFLAVTPPLPGENKKDPRLLRYIRSECPEIVEGLSSCLYGLVERMMGVEPTSSAWKADVFAVRRHSHKGGVTAFASCFNSKEVNCYAPCSGPEPDSLPESAGEVYIIFYT